MICQACFVVTRGDLCTDCRRGLHRVPERILRGGFRSVGVFEHTGPAAKLMHGLKYRGNEALLRVIAPNLSQMVAPGKIYVPVPRVWTRYVRYGIDPAQRLAQVLAAETKGQVLQLIRRPIHNRRRAGSAHRGGPPRFGALPAQLESVVLVDDVLTTGTTLLAAAQAIQPIDVDFFFTATAAKPPVRLEKSGV